MPMTMPCRDCASLVGRQFASMPEPLAERLARAIVRVGYRRAQTLFQEGTTPLACYCIHTGRVKLSRRWSDGHEVVVGVREAGELVGLRAILSEHPYATTAEVIEPSTVCVIPRDTFLDLVQHDHGLAMALLRLLAIDSRLTEEQVVARVRDSALVRTARLLVALAQTRRDPSQAEVAIGRERMMLLVGTTRETLSRTLHGLARKGLIDVMGNRIRVLDLPALRALIG
jgi:CRP/FNR family transcriptional regulator